MSDLPNITPNIDPDTGIPEGYYITDDPGAAPSAPFSWEKYQKARGKQKTPSDNITKAVTPPETTEEADDAPKDIFDAVLLQLQSEPWRVKSTLPGDELRMDTPEAKRQRERARLDAEQEKARATLEKAVTERQDAAKEQEYDSLEATEKSIFGEYSKEELDAITEFENEDEET